MTSTYSTNTTVCTNKHTIKYEQQEASTNNTHIQYYYNISKDY